VCVSGNGENGKNGETGEKGIEVFNSIPDKADKLYKHDKILVGSGSLRPIAKPIVVG
jgi:hypothetical protein